MRIILKHLDQHVYGYKHIQKVGERYLFEHLDGNKGRWLLAKEINMVFGLGTWRACEVYLVDNKKQTGADRPV